MMVKKGFCLVFGLLILGFLGFVPIVSANFVCGEVNNLGEISASWFDVSVNYVQDPGFLSNCKVSPANNRYCCDPQEIEEVNWEVGKNVQARIFDEASGYFTEPVSLEISGEGFDVFPVMQLKDAIIVHSPQESIFVNSSEIFVNVSIEESFDSISYVLNYSGEIVEEQEVCSNCENAEFFVNTQENGNYELTIVASNEVDEMKEVIKFTNLEFIDFSREFECESCSGNFVPANTEVNVTLTLSTSHDVTGILTENFPSNWQIVNNDEFDADVNSDGIIGIDDVLLILLNWGECVNEECLAADINGDGFVNSLDLNIVLANWTEDEPPNFSNYQDERLSDYSEDVLFNLQSPQLGSFSNSHESIEWEVSGNSISKTYALISPSDFLPTEYAFFSDFNNYESEIAEVIVYTLFRQSLLHRTRDVEDPLPISESIYSLTYLEISNSRPLIVNLDEELFEIGIFPKNTEKDVKAFVSEEVDKRLEGAYFHIKVDSNLKSKNLDKVLLRYKIEKPLSNSNQINLFWYNEKEEKWQKIETEKYKEESAFEYYEGYALRTGIFALKETETSNFFSRFLRNG